MRKTNDFPTENVENLISIIVPIYNAQAYLPRCIDSILGQSYQNFELILVNDGSKDDSGQICDSYANKDGRVRVFHNSNGGASFSRFYGMQKANGQFFCFVDADDSLPEDALEKLYSYSMQYDTDITIGGYTRFCDNKVIDYCGFPLNVISGNTYLYSLLSGNWKIYGPVAKLFKKELFVFPYPEIPKNIRVGEDLLMNVYFASHAKSVVYVPFSVYNYYQIDTSATHTFKYTIDYMRSYLYELQTILDQNKVPVSHELFCHYNIIIMYNVMLDDEGDEIDYQSTDVLQILQGAESIQTTLKEQTILFLLKHRFIRVLYRRMMKKYRTGSGFIHYFKKLLGK